jgi:hypothetical protein
MVSLITPQPSAMPVTPTASSSRSHPALAFQLWFASLFIQGRGYAFPCDAEGRVDLDALSRRSLANYLYARAVVGRELCAPCILPSPV